MHSEGSLRTFLGLTRPSVLRIEERNWNLCTYFQPRESEGIQLDGAGVVKCGGSRGERNVLGDLGKEALVCKGVGDWAQQFLLLWRSEIDAGCSQRVINKAVRM